MGNLQIVRKICTNPRQKHEIFMRDNHNRTVLHIAVICENISVEMVKYLLEQPGIDTRARSDNRDTALSLACGYRLIPLEIIALLIAKDPEVVNWVNNDFVSPLQKAFQSRRPDVVRFLIEKGRADPNYINKKGEHALFYAVRHFEMVTVNFLMNETNCDIKHQNHNGETAFESIHLSSILYNDRNKVGEHFFVHMFRSTYNEFSSPKLLAGVLRFCNNWYGDRQILSNAVKQAILEIFYENPRSNPDYYGLVTRIKDINGDIDDQFWLCLPLQSKEVLEKFDADIFRYFVLKTLFQLFLCSREIFDDYLTSVAQNVSFYRIQSLSFLDRHAMDASTSGLLLEFVKSVCWTGFNVDFTFHDENLEKILYPLLPFDRPFIPAPTTLDTWICRRFEETDSVDDVENYKIFKLQYLKRSGLGHVPKLFNLCRTVVRKTVFQAADSSSNKLFNLHSLTLELPITIKKRLFYLPL